MLKESYIGNSENWWYLPQNDLGINPNVDSDIFWKTDRSFDDFIHG